MKKIYSKDESLCLYLKTNLFSSLDRVKNLLKINDLKNSHVLLL